MLRELLEFLKIYFVLQIGVSVPEWASERKGLSQENRLQQLQMNRRQRRQCLMGPMN